MTYSAGDYFPAMGIEVVRGRTFTEADHTSQLGNILVSRSAADLLWPGENPIGQRLQMDGQEVWETVVGVVGDVMQYEFRQAPDPMVYFPLVGQDPENRRTLSSLAYVVKTMVHAASPRSPPPIDCSADAAGRAKVVFTLGHRAGVGNQVVEFSLCCRWVSIRARSCRGQAV